MRPVALTIAGSDPTGGAGLGADLRVFAAHGVWGCAVPSLITAQSTRGVSRVIPLEAQLVIQPFQQLFQDVVVSAWKTGALGSREIVEALAQVVPSIRVPLVIDPVLVASRGAVLLDEDARTGLVRDLFPHAALVTPNAPEAALLTGRPAGTLSEAADAARALADGGARAVLVKGGHLSPEQRSEKGARGQSVIDILLVDGVVHELVSPRVVVAGHVHGTGCALSAAITARLARGEALIEACAGAKRWLNEALATAHPLGHGDLVMDFPPG